MVIELQHIRLDTVPHNWSNLLSPGRRLTTLVHDPQEYYHSVVHFLFDDGGILKAAAHEHYLHRSFFSYTLTLEISTEALGNRISLSPLFEIEEVYALIRDEWVVPAVELEGKTIGNNPHYHISGLPGSAPDGTLILATCLAGVLVVSQDGRQLAISAAVDVPLNVDVISDSGELKNIIGRHECRLLGAGA
ncbi:MAG: hypothetical protein OEO83_10920 [Alphaproteobacteria bacterium]|nr:hypothetical protein [Alphaproteobacteria bacterium]